MTGDPLLVKVADFCLWLGSALGAYGTFYFLGPEQNLKWSFACIIVMVFFLSFRDGLIERLRRKISKRNEEA